MARVLLKTAPVWYSLQSWFRFFSNSLFSYLGELCLKWKSTIRMDHCQVHFRHFLQYNTDWTIGWWLPHPSVAVALCAYLSISAKLVSWNYTSRTFTNNIRQHVEHINGIIFGFRYQNYIDSKAKLRILIWWPSWKMWIEMNQFIWFIAMPIIIPFLNIWYINIENIVN